MPWLLSACRKRLPMVYYLLWNSLPASWKFVPQQKARNWPWRRCLFFVFSCSSLNVLCWLLLGQRMETGDRVQAFSLVRLSFLKLTHPTHSRTYYARDTRFFSPPQRVFNSYSWKGKPDLGGMVKASLRGRDLSLNYPVGSCSLKRTLLQGKGMVRATHWYRLVTALPARSAFYLPYRYPYNQVPAWDGNGMTVVLGNMETWFFNPNPLWAVF